MKNFAKIALAVLLSACVLGLASCSSEKAPAETDTPAVETTETTETPAEETPVEETTPAEETPVEETAPAVEETPVEETAPATSGTVIDNVETFHYKTWHCVFVDGENGENGHFEDDEMAPFIEANPEWYKDTASMAKWDEAEGPFGDRLAPSANAGTEWTTDPANYHGIMFYKTFNIDTLDGVTYSLNMFYDNTVYIYINGEEYFVNDANCGSGDWTDDYVDVAPSDESKTLNDFLKTGENYIAVSLKDCWGGREFDMNLSYEAN